MYAFHASLHIRPTGVAPGPLLLLRGQMLPTLGWPAHLTSQPWEITFEEAAAALERLERMYCEPDGSWVWRGPAWQLDGQLADHQDRLRYVELRGMCPPEAFDTLLAALGAPPASLAYQLHKEGAWLNDPSFRVYAQLHLSPEESLQVR